MFGTEKKSDVPLGQNAVSGMPRRAVCVRQTTHGKLETSKKECGVIVLKILHKAGSYPGKTVTTVTAVANILRNHCNRCNRKWGDTPEVVNDA